MPWACGRRGLNGRDFSPPILELRRRLSLCVGDAIEQHHFMLPDFLPERAAIAEVTNIGVKPMSAQRFLYYFREILAEAPYRINRSDLAPIVAHSFRHGMPTIGYRVALSVAQQVALGLWSARGCSVQAGTEAS